MEKNFDLVVIGTGAGGAAAAHKCKRAGWEVAIVDSRPYGGTCALRGCDPKKVLIGAAELIDWSRRMEGRGVRSTKTSIDWTALMRFKESFTAPVPEKRERGYADAGIHAFHGRARFLDGSTVEVGGERLRGRFVHIATGARPATLGLEGEHHLITSERFLELAELPRRVAFVGGGYISFEFAHVAARAGAEARVLHRGERPLENFEPHLVERLVDATRETGIDVRLNASVRRIEMAGGEFVVHASTPSGEETFAADAVVHGAGRVPEIDDLALEAAGVERGEKGVKVNEFMQSVSNPNVYAAGDAAASGGPPLTPVASMEGHVAASNMLEGSRKRPNYEGVPTVVFTIPPMASVGLREAEARERGLKFRVEREDTSGWFSSRRVGEKHSGYAVLVEEGSERILGAHLLGLGSEEVVNLFGLAVRHGLTARDLKTYVYAYPTRSSDVSYMV